MTWYEHLFGILAVIFTVIGIPLIMTCIAAIWSNTPKIKKRGKRHEW